jgi:hypothetical protein
MRKGVIFERVPEMGYQRKLLVIGKVEHHDPVNMGCDRPWRWLLISTFGAQRALLAQSLALLPDDTCGWPMTGTYVIDLAGLWGGI